MAEGPSFGRALADRALEQPDSVAFRFVERPGGARAELTCGALWRRAAATASAVLTEAAPGSRVGIACTSLSDYVVAVAACLISGLVAVPLPAALARRTASRARAILAAARPEAVLVSGRAPRWLALDVPAIAVAGEDAEAGPDVGPPPSNESLALIQFSSGATGEPKGIALTHGNLVAGCASIVNAYGLDHASRGFAWLPLHHDMGLIGHVITPFFGGVTTLTGPLLFLQRPLTWLEFVTRERATITSAPNFAFELAARAGEQLGVDGLDLGSLTAVVCGGEPIARSTIERFVSVFGPAGLDPGAIAPSYGLAEATLLVSSGRRPGGPVFVPRPGGGMTADLGAAVDAVSIRITRPDGSDADPGEIGEIEVSGASVGQLVGANREWTQASAIRTGDLGFLDGGRLRVTGRLKEIIIVKGQNVYASDIEAAAMAAHDDVVPGGVCAFGHERDGTEEVMLAVEIAPGSTCPPSDIAASVSGAVVAGAGIAPLAVLIARVGTLSRTPSGKVRRHVVSQDVAGRNLSFLWPEDAAI